MCWEVEDLDDSDSIISDHCDTEYIEHDQALGVFKSPRPSYTLSEAELVDLRERLAEEEDLNSVEISPFETAIPLGSSTELQRPISGTLEDENPWALSQQSSTTDNKGDAIMARESEEPAVGAD